MADLPYIVVLVISSATLLLGIIEIIILCRILNNQGQQNKSITNIISNNTEALGKAFESLIRTEERIDKYQSSTNEKLDTLKDLTRGGR